MGMVQTRMTPITIAALRVVVVACKRTPQRQQQRKQFSDSSRLKADWDGFLTLAMRVQHEREFSTECLSASSAAAAT